MGRTRREKRDGGGSADSADPSAAHGRIRVGVATLETLVDPLIACT